MGDESFEYCTVIARVAESEDFGWSRIFCPTPDVQLDHFLHHTPTLGIPVEMVTFSFETFVETEISCCAPRFPLILTVKFHSLYVKESGVGNFGKVGVGYFTSDSATLVIAQLP